MATFTIDTITNARWNDASHMSFDALVKFVEEPNPLPYTFQYAEWQSQWALLIQQNIAEYTVPAPQAEPTNEQINNERERRIMTGCIVDIENVGRIYLTGDRDSKDNLQGLAFGASLRLSAGDNTTLSDFRDENNDMFLLTPQQVVTLWFRGSAYISAVYKASWQLKDGVTPLDFTDNKYWPRSGF